ncbi:hypothetical protein TNCV_1617091 [Trichonephila clavipes]|nr:hypothetical protein TNCV_1617091 [Trichonephila clavipes]
MPTVHRTIGGPNTSGFQSRVYEAMDALWTFHSAANGVDWCGVVVRRGDANSRECRPCQLTRVQIYEIRHQKPLCILTVRR